MELFTASETATWANILVLSSYITDTSSRACLQVLESPLSVKISAHAFLGYQQILLISDLSFQLKKRHFTADN